MALFLLSGLLFIILAAGGSSQHYRTLIPNVIVVEKDLESTTEVPLVCGAAYDGTEISWRREGTPLPKRGNRITISVQEMMGGNFTCHDSTGVELDHQLVLVQQIQRQDRINRRILQGTGDADYIKCLSRNYSGIFRCSWQWSQDRIGAVVHVSAKRSTGRDNITCSVDEDESGITCLDQVQCPFSEELDYIHLSVYIRHMYRFEEYVSQFSITEIVKPDKIGINRVNDNTFEMEYPKTWSGPESYFPLTFHIKVIPPKKGRDCTYTSERVQEIRTRNQTFSVGNRREFRLCVSAQDDLCNSGWSEWNHYEVKRTQ